MGVNPEPITDLIGRLRFATTPMATESGNHGMDPDAAVRQGLDMLDMIDKTDQLGIQREFFLQFAQHAVPQGFAGLDSPPGRE